MALWRKRRLEFGLNACKLHTVIDACHICFITYGKRAGLARRGHELHHVGQIEFALSIGGFELLQRWPQIACGNGNDAGIAKRNGAFSLACIFVLADGRDDVAPATIKRP